MDFDKMLAMREQYDPNRVVPADGWTPDTDVLLAGRTYIETILRTDGLAQAIERTNSDWVEPTWWTEWRNER